MLRVGPRSSVTDDTAALRMTHGYGIQYWEALIGEQLTQKQRQLSKHVQQIMLRIGEN